MDQLRAKLLKSLQISSFPHSVRSTIFYLLPARSNNKEKYGENNPV